MYIYIHRYAYTSMYIYIYVLLTNMIDNSSVMSAVARERRVVAVDLGRNQRVICC